REGTSDRRACSSVSPSRQLLSSPRCSSRNTSNWSRVGSLRTSSADVAGREGMTGVSQKRYPAVVVSAVFSSSSTESSCACTDNPGRDRTLPGNGELTEGVGSVGLGVAQLAGENYRALRGLIGQ